MKRHALATGKPLLTRYAMGVLGVDVLGQHGLFSCGTLDHTDLAKMALGVGGGEKQHTRTVRAFRIGEVITVRAVPPFYG